MSRREPYLHTSDVIAGLLNVPVATVVQIGSNDGITGDPVYPVLIRRPEWKALLVEPVPHLFERLKQTWSHRPGFTFVNAAANEGRDASFYWVDPAAKDQFPDLPDWFEQLGSFDRGHIVRHLGRALESYIRCTEVQGIRLPDLLQREQVHAFDLLHIDAEGYDERILSQFDPLHYRPSIVLYEHKHLSTAARMRAIARLAPCYELFDLGPDVLAVRRREDLLSRCEISDLSVRRIPWPGRPGHLMDGTSECDRS